MFRAIPGPTGRKHLAATYGMLTNPYATLLAMYREYGSVFQLGYKPYRYIYLIGPEANRAIMATHAGNFRWREAFQNLIPVDGPTALIVSDGADHRRRRSLVQPAFHKKRLDGYLGIMQQATRTTIASWNNRAEINVYSALRQTIRQIVIQALFGEKLAAQHDELGQHLEILLQWVNLLPSQQLEIDLPWTQWHAVKAANLAVDQIIYTEIARRREHPSNSNDMLDWLLAAQDAEAGSLSDLEVRDQVVSLIAAGYETTSAAMGWLLYAMLKDRRHWQAAQAEVAAVLGDQPLTIEALPQFSLIDRLIAETLRLYSPAFIGLRQNQHPFEFAGYTIPAGAMLGFSQYVTHRMPEIWPNPERFDPERWNPQAANYHNPTPYEYIPFGGGARRCIGSEFAKMELKVLLIELLQQTELDLLRREIAMTGLASVLPKGGVPVVVTKRQLGD